VQSGEVIVFQLFLQFSPLSENFHRVWGQFVFAVNLIISFPVAYFVIQVQLLLQGRTYRVLAQVQWVLFKHLPHIAVLIYKPVLIAITSVPFQLIVHFSIHSVIVVIRLNHTELESLH